MTASASTAYELTVKALLAAELRKAGLGDLRCFHLKRYAGKSGQKHEIDVSFEARLGKLRLLFVVECKKHRRRVGVDDVLAFAYRMNDIGAHKGLIVASSGFQRGAMTVARAERIGLLSVAQGSLVSCWDGALPQYATFWITRFSLDASEDLQSVSLVGHRQVVCNAVWEAAPLDVHPPEDPNGAVLLYFLLPEEQSMMTSGDKNSECVQAGVSFRTRPPNDEADRLIEVTIV